ncbi:MAG TPA: hypothetical protein VFZ85_10570 [Jiangellaceae bacterium]
MVGTVLFVCPHGAGKSKVAAAVFDREVADRAGLAGWRAVTAGVEPAEAVSEHAVRLLKGSSEELFLDHRPPRSLEATIDAVGPVDRIIAVDCAPDGTTSSDEALQTSWHLTDDWPNRAVLVELRRLVRGVVSELEEQTRD